MNIRATLSPAEILEKANAELGQGCYPTPHFRWKVKQHFEALSTTMEYLNPIGGSAGKVVSEFVLEQLWYAPYAVKEAWFEVPVEMET